MRDITVCCEVPFNAAEFSLAGVLESQGLHDAVIDTTVARASADQTKKCQGLGIRLVDATRMPDFDQ